MFKTECLLTVVALSIGLANSWDIAFTIGGQVELLTNQTKSTIDGARFKELTALAYDAVHDMLLFVDKQNDNASIFSYHFSTKKYQALVRRSSENIQGIAFDPVTGLLFWIDDTAKSIFYKSLMPGAENKNYGNTLLELEPDEIPSAIAVDSCRGYIYWTNINITNPSIQRVKFDGTDRKKIITKDIFLPVAIAIDQKTKRLIWADDTEGIKYSIQSSDLEGNNRETLYSGTEHRPIALTITKDSIYWIDWAYLNIWKLDRNEKDAEPTIIYKYYYNVRPVGIVGNYTIAEQTGGVPECEALLKLSQNNTPINDTFNIPKDVGLFCLHGNKLEGKSVCQCSPGYIGERCEVSLCHNYCLHGKCSLTKDNQPQCSCEKGFKGEKCEVDLCNGYCLNNGECSTNDDQVQSCLCPKDFEGTRCETPVVTTVPTTPPAVVVSEPIEKCNCEKCHDQVQSCLCPEVSKCETPVVTTAPTTTPPAVVVSEPTEKCNCSSSEPTYVYAASSDVPSAEGEFIECGQGWDPVRDPVIVVLGVMCGLLCVACTVLVTKVLHLKRRPRIKKRIIVNKNVTPMTARPDQCEITIENCCNMNICETPCFEPRSTIRPSLGDAKPGKEEKKNLISNMEHPDDY